MSYSLGERVWAMVDGFPWWPAKVVSADEVNAEVPAGQEDCDTCVMYYGTHDIGFFNSQDPDHIMPFEESSEKAVTSDDSLTAALEECSGDLDAADLREDDHVPKSNGHSANARNAKSQKIVGRKRNRSPGAQKKRKSHADEFSGSDDEGLQTTEFTSATNSTLIDLKKQIDTAAAANDISALRAALLTCASIHVSFEQLKTTKIGVSVGDLFSKAECRHVHALVHAIVCFWAMSMPQETRTALEQMQQLHAHHGGDAPLAGRQQLPVAPAGGQPQGAGVVEAIRKSFTNFPAEVAAFDAAKVLAIAQQIRDALPTDELKRRAVGHLRRAGHGDLRARLLNGSLTAEAFAELVPGDINTMEEQRLVDAKEALIDHAPVIDGAYSELFECPKCEKSRVTYHEKQIRSADEAATVFLECLECKYAWTVND